MEISGKTVLITGASRGIGRAAAKAFAENGANVVLFARNGAALKQIAEDIGHNALPLEGDISVYGDIASAVKKTLSSFGTIDILINNAAALQPIAHQAEADPASWAALIDVNIKGVFYANHCVLPIMKA
ncbi:MAG: SDR family NAD(P)-dependent oxidoreductase, partial [Rhodobacteraceae bacterium]|nr:SDR family NAD(P)-dependent oxidoreductase [Paracoccaceae bacterium]